MTPTALLTSWGIEHFPDVGWEERRKFFCPKCGGAAELAPVLDGTSEVILICKCAPMPGRRFDSETMLAAWFGINTSGAAAMPLLVKAAASPQFEVWSYHDFLAQDFGKDQPIVSGLLDAGTLAAFYGPSGSAKSWSGAEVVLSVAAGRKAFGRYVCVKGAGILVEMESPRRKLQRRLHLLEAGDPLPTDAAEIRIFPVQTGFALAEQATLDTLSGIIREIGARGLVIDTLVAAAGRLDLLDASEVRAFCTPLRVLADSTGIFLLLLAHTPKYAGKDPDLTHFFGSVDWGASMDACYEFVRLSDRYEDFRCCCTKGRWDRGQDWPDFTFTISEGPSGGLIVASTEEKATVDAIILRSMSFDCDTSTKTIYEAADKRGFKERYARESLERLLNAGTIKLSDDSTSHKRSFRRLR